MQATVAPSLTTSRLPTTSMLSIGSKMLRNEGALSFYKGVLYPVIASGVINAGFFGVYEATRHWLGAHRSTKSSNACGSSYVDVYVAGVLGAITVQSVSIPVRGPGTK